MNDNPEKWLRKLRSRNRLLVAMPWLGRVAEWRQLLRAANRWRSEGWFTPVPYFVRRAQLLEAGRKIGATIAVETGTFRGDTTAALAGHFREVHTIEVVPALADLARERFRAQPSITVWDGDSPQVLRALLPKLDGPTLFYLDGHDSGGVTGKGDKACPVREELEIIFENFTGMVHVVIDDARLFGTDPDYPSLGEIRDWMERLRPGTSVRVENDAILIETAAP
jgi:hypothetical protein